MQNRYLDQLKSTNPDERREAIIALGKQKDAAALKPLAEIYQNDPDPALRELAFKAGRYIRSMTAEMPAAPVARATAPEMPRVDPDELRITSDQPDVPVKASNVEKARGYFNLALDYQVRNQNDKAIDAMGKAIEANPNLRNDSMFVNLAMELTNLGSGAAVRLLSDPIARKEFVRNRDTAYMPEGKAKRKPVEEATWNAALVDVGIYAVANGALVFFALLVGFQAIMQFFAASMAASGAAFPIDSTSITVPTALIIALLYAVLAVIGLLIYYGAIHLAATTVMGGDGTMPGLIRKVTVYYTILSVALTLLSFIPIIFLNDRNLYNLFQGISSIASIIGLVFLGKLVGDAYQFGTGKGCASIFVGSIGIAIVFACCGFALISALSQTVANAGGF
jgi:tetratricopeptide (TPR) repeat protein